MIEPCEALIARVLKIPKSAVTQGLEFQSIPAWDSLSHVDLMLELEAALNVEIDADMVLRLNSVDAIREFAGRHSGGRGAAAGGGLTAACSAGGAPRVSHAPDVEAPFGESEADELFGRSVNEGPQARDTVADPAIRRGLNGVFLDSTRTTFMDGRTGELLYRGYSIHDLAEHATFEEVTYLLLYGVLPTRARLTAFGEELKSSRGIPPEVEAIIASMRGAHPMDVLRSAVSALAAYDPDRNDDSLQANLRKGLRLIAQIPTIVATHEALRNGRAPVAPSSSLQHAANFLYMLNGERPGRLAAELMDKDFVLHADHGSNASAFAARVVAGTRADMHSAVTAAIAAFSGPLHGGAAEDVMKMVQEIGEPERAPEYVQRRRAANEPVMGFGHRVYRTEDPRVRHLRQGAKLLSETMNEPKWFAILEAVVEAMRPYGRHGIHVNVDFYAGAAYNLLSIPQDLFVPVFVVGRIAGWVAQTIEQFENNILIRPLLHYVGEMNLPYVPLEQRDGGPRSPSEELELCATD